jgi:hypothetical protein
MARALLKTPTVPQIRESGRGDVRLSLHGQSHHRLHPAAGARSCRAGEHDSGIIDDDAESAKLAGHPLDRCKPAAARSDRPARSGQ